MALNVSVAVAASAATVPPAGESAQRLSAIVSKPVALSYLIWMPPAEAERPAAGWPLVIFLHGSGERGEDLDQVKAHGLPELAAAGHAFPFVLVAPQVPNELAWDSDALEALRADLVARLPIDVDRVLMTGMSMGGYGTWNYAVDYPDRLAGIAPVCGIGDSDRAERLRRVPVWAFHGALDDSVPIAGDQEMVDTLRAVGGNVRFTVYPDVGHDAWERAYAEKDLYDWLLAQKRSSPR